MNQANTAVLELLEELRAAGAEEGVQVCAYLDGECVIDTWAGIADPSTGQPVDGDSIFTIFSATKGVSATCMHILADRGRLDYEQRIDDLWPGFGVNGKENATVRHAMLHQIGIPYLPEGVTPEQLCDWGYMCDAFAQMPALWEPGTRTGYHSLNYNYFAGQIVKGADGRSIRDFLQDELCRPLGVDSMFLGIPDDIEERIAPVIASSGEDSATGAGVDRATLSNLPCVRRSHWRGMGNARSLARIYAMLANGGELDGVRILSEERIRIATAVQFDGEDTVLKRRLRRGLVYQLGAGGTAASFGHSGGGGTLAFADPERRFSFAYTKNLHAAPLPDSFKASSGPASQAMLLARRCREVLAIS